MEEIESKPLASSSTYFSPKGPPPGRKLRKLQQKFEFMSLRPILGDSGNNQRHDICRNDPDRRVKAMSMKLQRDRRSGMDRRTVPERRCGLDRREGTEPSKDVVFDTKDACRYLRISRPTFLKFIADERIRAKKVGRGWKTLKSQLDKLLLSGD